MLVIIFSEIFLSQRKQVDGGKMTATTMMDTDLLYEYRDLRAVER